MLIPLVFASVLHVANAAGCSASGPGTPGQPFCAIQPAVNASADGDTVQVHAGTYTEVVLIPKRTGTAIIGDVTSGGFPVPLINGGFDFGPVGGDQFQLKNFYARGTTAQIVRIQPKSSGSYWTHIAVSNFYTDVPPSGPTLGFGTGSGNYPDGVSYDLIVIHWPTKLINFFGAFGKNYTFTRIAIIGDGGTYGHLILSSSVTSTIPGVAAITVRDSVFKDVGCGLLTDGDGCFQVYNSTYEVSYSAFVNVVPRSSSIYGLADARRTNTAQKPAGLRFHHNTLVLASSVLGSSQRQALELVDSAVDAFWDVHDNIIQGYGSGAVGGAAIYYRSCGKPADSTGPALVLTEDYNLFFNNVNELDNSGCLSAGLGGHDVFADPQLDPVTLVPAATSPAAHGGTGGGFIGAYPAASGGPSPSPSPTQQPSPSPSPTQQPSPSPTPVQCPSPSPTPPPYAFDIHIHLVCDAFGCSFAFQ